MRRQPMAAFMVTLMVANVSLAASSDASASSEIAGLSSEAIVAGYANDVLVPDATAFREAFGFPSDPATVNTLLDGQDTNYDFGGPLSAAEAEDMAYRVSVMDTTEVLGSYVDARADVFGGLYYQHVPAFSVVVLVTRKASDADIAGALDLVPAGAPVETRLVDRSLGTLRKGVDSIDKARAANKWRIGSVGVDVVRNTVRVGRIKGAVDDDAVRTAAATGVVFHEKVGVTPTACTRTDCSPVRGGIYITNSGTGKCTLGLSAKSGTVRYLITAGHCDDGEHYWKQAGVKITNATDRNSWNVSAAKSDSLRAPYISSGRVGAPYNTIYVNSSIPAKAMTSKDNTPTVGDITCVSAWFYGNAYKCGTVLDASELIPIPGGGGYLWINGVISSIPHNTTNGESGSPAFNNGSTFHGIVEAAFDNPAGAGEVLVYTKPSIIETDLNVTFCMTSAC